jgi:hypothetical protein
MVSDTIPDFSIVYYYIFKASDTIPDFNIVYYYIIKASDTIPGFNIVYYTFMGDMKICSPEKSHISRVNKFSYLPYAREMNVLFHQANVLANSAK